MAANPTIIESAVSAAIAAGKINGAVICATDTSGAFTYDRALGERTLLSGEKRPQRLDDLLYLASATKLLATIAALQCVDDGLLTLRGDLAGVAPELAMGTKQVLPEGADGDDALQPATRPITLEGLLTHTSGEAYDFMVPRLAAWRERNEPPFPEGETRPVEEAFAYPLAFQPGTAWMYGPGLDWAGRIVERVTGQTLGGFIHKRICEPLGIPTTDVQFFPVKGEDVRERMVDLNPEDPEGLGKAVLNGAGVLNQRSKGDFGGHGLFMTGEGFVKVLHSLLKNDGKLLRPETVDDMFQNHIGADAEENFRVTMEGPGSEFFRVGTAPGSKIGHGLGGLLTLEDAEGWYGEGTLSWGGGMTFAWFVDRKNGLCGVGALQAAMPVDVGAVMELKQVFRHDIYRKLAAWKEEGQQSS